MRYKRLLIIVICMNVLIPMVYAGRRCFFNEKFENTDEGFLPIGWTKPDNKADMVCVENSYADQGKKSLKLTETPDGSSVWVRSPKFKANIVKDFEVSFSFRIKGDASARAVFLLLDENEEKAIGINCRLGDNWRYSCAQSLWMDIPGLSTSIASETYVVSIIVDTQNAQMKVEINGVESDWVPIWMGWEYISKVGFHNNDEHPSEFWIDDLTLREAHIKKQK